MKRWLAAGLGALLLAAATGAIAYTSGRSGLADLRDAFGRQERVTDQARDTSERYFADARAERARVRELRRRIEREANKTRRWRGRFYELSCFGGRGARRFRGPSRRADVSGDGISDVVALIGIPRGDEPCSYELRVGVGGGMWHIKRYRRPGGNEHIFPAVLLHDLDGDGGQEVFVQTGQGAYATYGKIFTLATGELQRVRGMGGDQWIYGASAGNGSRFECPNPGTVVRTSWSFAPRGRGHEVTRRVYRVSAATATLVERERFLMREWDSDLVTAGPFCFAPRGLRI